MAGEAGIGLLVIVVAGPRRMHAVGVDVERRLEIVGDAIFELGAQVGGVVMTEDAAGALAHHLLDFDMVGGGEVGGIDAREHPLARPRRGRRQHACADQSDRDPVAPHTESHDTLFHDSDYH